MQGSWLPPVRDPSFPRSYPDSLEIPLLRNSLTDPDLQPLYNPVWWNAGNVIPSGNSTYTDRFTRAGIAREAAFIYLMDRKPVGNTIVPLAPADRDTMLNRAIMLLETMNTDVDVGTFWTFYNPWQHRSKELISYLIAYDHLRGAGVPESLLQTAGNKLIQFTGNLYQKAMASYTFLNLQFFTYQFNNHSIMTASALGLAAVILAEHTSTNVNQQPQNWINAGLYNLDNTLWMENGVYPRVSEPDTLAGYAEGPNYFKYGFENAFPFIRAMGNYLPDGYFPVTFSSTTRSIRNPWFDDRYDRIYDWMNRIRMPDGSSPAIHDSYAGFGTTITALSGKPWFNWYNPGFTPDELMIRSQYIATHIPHGEIDDSLFQPLPAAGSLVFRSSWSADAIYMHFIGKHGIALTGAKAHHQGDASSFSLAAFGQLLAVDPGYPGASQASLTNKAEDHSLILVNGSGPLPPNGELVSTSTNTAYIEHCFDTPLLDFGEVRVSYSGAEIIRRNLFIRNRYFLLADFASSASSKTYTWQIQGHGLAGGAPTSPEGAFYPDYSNNQGWYRRDTTTLVVRLTTPGVMPAFSHSTDSMAIAGGFRKYSRMTASQNASQTVFLTALYPAIPSDSMTLDAQRTSQAAALQVVSPGYRDLVFSSFAGIPVTFPAGSLPFAQPVTGNGKVNFYSETDQGLFSSAFIQQGDSLNAGTRQIIQMVPKGDLTWMHLDSVLAAGYISGAAIVRIYSGSPMLPISGPFQSVGYDTASGMVVAQFSGKGNFLMGRDGLTWVWSGSVSHDWHDPANWQLQGHSNIHGVPQSTHNVLIVASAPRMPVVEEANPATCHDLTIETGAGVSVPSMRFLNVYGTVILKY